MLFGQCPHGGGDKLKGASLTDRQNPIVRVGAAGVTDTVTGLATTNSTNRYQKYKSVDLGHQLVDMDMVDTNMVDSEYFSGENIFQG